MLSEEQKEKSVLCIRCRHEKSRKSRIPLGSNRQQKDPLDLKVVFDHNHHFGHFVKILEGHELDVKLAIVSLHN